MQRQFDDVLLGSIELFCLAAELGSFTAAGLAAGVTPAAVSRSIGRLGSRSGWVHGYSYAPPAASA
jgi:hypothetical protein